MTVVVPVLINTKNNIEALKKTIEKLYSISSNIIVVSQGEEPKFLQKIQNIKYQHFDQPLGKWSAVEKAKKFDCSDMIFIHDGDDPFQADSYSGIEKIEKNTFIQRNDIILSALDSISYNSRKYIELFLNVLSFNSKKLINQIDIQSGGMILSNRIFKSIDFDVFGDYGGELKVYEYLAFNKVQVEMFQMKVEKNKYREISNYTIEKILNKLIDHPIDQDKLDRCITETINLYPNYIYNEDGFKQEIEYYMKKYNKVKYA